MKGSPVEDSKLTSVAEGRPRNSKVKAIIRSTLINSLKPPTLQAHRFSWIRTAFIVTCAAAVLTLLYWKLASAQVLYQLILPELHDNDGLGPAFTVRDLPGRGKGMIAVRDIRVGIPRCLEIRRLYAI